MAVDVEPCAKLLCCYVAGACLKRVEGAKLVSVWIANVLLCVLSWAGEFI